jgi:hypothetical protein
MMKKATRREVLIDNFTFEGESLSQLKVIVDKMIEKYGGSSLFTHDYYGYDGAYDVVLYKVVEESDAEFAERVLKEQLKEQKVLAKREERRIANEEKLSNALISKEQSEREFLKMLQEKYKETP